MKEIVIDVETESAADLPVGAYAYATHKSTHILCVSWRERHAPPESTQTWYPSWDSHRIPYDLQVAIATGGIFYAFNAFFEQCIWNLVLTKKYDWPPIKPHQWRCLAALSAYYGAPQNLDRSLKALGLGEKDSEGNKLMLKMTNPLKRPQTVLSNWEANLQRLYEYCEHDVDDECLILDKLGALPKTEQTLWLIDQKINFAGIPFDVELVKAAVLAVETIKKQACDRLTDMSGGAITSPGQVQRMIKLCRAYGTEVDNLQSATVDKLLKGDLQPVVREVLEVRKAAGTAAVKKFAKALTQIVDGRARGLNRYYGAHTGRWSGQGTQPQNMPRAHFDNQQQVEQWIDYVLRGDFSQIDLGTLTDALTKLVRPSICAAPGKTFVAGDFAGIELRVLHWLVGDEDTLNTVRTHGSKRVYLDMACAIFGCDVTKEDTFRYTAGKVAVLALGYQGAAGAFARMAESYGIEVDPNLASKTVAIYRSKNRLVRAAWKAVERRAISVVSDGGVMTWNGVKFEFRGGALVITLPSGRELWYRDAHIRDTDFGKQVHYYGDKSGRWTLLSTYGGLLIENIVQAIARDILVQAMFEVESHNLNIVSHCYDEIVLEVDQGRRSSALKHLEIAMTRSPRWAKNLPLSVDSWVGKRYRK